MSGTELAASIVAHLFFYPFCQGRAAPAFCSLVHCLMSSSESTHTPFPLRSRIFPTVNWLSNALSNALCELQAYIERFVGILALKATLIAARIKIIIYYYLWKRRVWDCNRNTITHTGTHRREIRF